MGIASATGRRRYRVPKGRRVIIRPKPEKAEDRARTVSRRLSRSSSPSSSSAPMAASTADLVGMAHLPTHLKLQMGATRLARSPCAYSTAGRRIDREILRLSARMLRRLSCLIADLDGPSISRKVVGVFRARPNLLPKMGGSGFDVWQTIRTNFASIFSIFLEQAACERRSTSCRGQTRPVCRGHGREDVRGSGWISRHTPPRS